MKERQILYALCELKTDLLTEIELELTKDRLTSMYNQERVISHNKRISAINKCIKALQKSMCENRTE